MKLIIRELRGKNIFIIFERLEDYLMQIAGVKQKELIKFL